MQEVEAICTQVLIINDGRIAAQGSPEEIAGTMKGGDTWELILKGAGYDADTGAVGGKLSSLGNISNAAAETTADGYVCASFFIPAETGGANTGERIFDWAVSQNLKILGMSRKKISIEDIFVKLTSDEKERSK